MPITMSNDEIRAVYRQGEDAVVSLIQSLIQRLNMLEEQVKKLTGQKNKDSHNSSKPPASDMHRSMPKNLRGTSEKKSGGQPGHEGCNLRQVENPDTIIPHRVKGNCCCGRAISKGTLIEIIRKQGIDFPETVKLEVTEHQAEVWECQCGRVHTAQFPDGITAAVQYGKRIRAMITYLSSYQLIPQKRTTDMMADLFGVPISQGTVNNILQRAFDRLAPTIGAIKASILLSSVVHADETGFYVNGKRIWEHSLSTELFTYYFCHEKRGNIAHKENGTLDQFCGRLVHDGWVSYFDFDCLHALCNAHHLRELIFVSEEKHQNWAATMVKLLCHIKKVVDRAKAAGRVHLAPQTIRLYKSRYEALIAKGYKRNPLPEQQNTPGKRGRKKQSPERNLLGRLEKYADETLAFMYDFSIPFDNNMAERDLRMTKVKQKISGCFRSMNGAHLFCGIRSYISTVSKHGLNVFEKLVECFDPNVTQSILLPIPGE